MGIHYRAQTARPSKGIQRNINAAYNELYREQHRKENNARKIHRELFVIHAKHQAALAQESE